MNLEELKMDCAKKQKKGLHIILASIVIWTLIVITHLMDIPMQSKNFITFFCTAPLLPLSYLIS